MRSCLLASPTATPLLKNLNMQLAVRLCESKNVRSFGAPLLCAAVGHSCMQFHACNYRRIGLQLAPQAKHVSQAQAIKGWTLHLSSPSSRMSAVYICHSFKDICHRLVYGFGAAGVRVLVSPMDRLPRSQSTRPSKQNSSKCQPNRECGMCQLNEFRLAPPWVAP
jgi:hypothetical protein